MREAQLQAPEGWKRTRKRAGVTGGGRAEGGASLALCELMGRGRLVPQAAPGSPEKGAIMERLKIRGPAQPTSSFITMEMREAVGEGRG